jgi:hypothetical protein
MTTFECGICKHKCGIIEYQDNIAVCPKCGIVDGGGILYHYDDFTEYYRLMNEFNKGNKK